MTLERLVLGAFLLLGSCAYRTGDSRGSDEILRVFVPVLENVTVRPVDMNGLTSAFRESLESIKGVQIVNSEQDADIVLLARVTRYDRSWGPTAYKGTRQTEAAGGLREDRLSASTARINLAIDMEKRKPGGERLWASTFAESDLYELSDRLEIARGSAATMQIHVSREALLVKKLAERIFRRARAQIVDDF